MVDLWGECGILGRLDAPVAWVMAPIFVLRGQISKPSLPSVPWIPIFVIPAG